MKKALAVLFLSARDGLVSLTKGKLRLIAIDVSWQISKRLAPLLGDPTTSFRLAGRSIKLPMSHALPTIRMRLPDYSSNIGRVARAVFRKYLNATMIDIGANVGDTAIIVRDASLIPILCIEGDDNFYSFLKMNIQGMKDVEAEQAFVGRAKEVMQGALLTDAGTARFSASSQSSIESLSLTDILQSQPKYQKPKLIKIDTDGFDTTILDGILCSQLDSSPLILFEYDPHFAATNDPDHASIFRRLRRYGYVYAMFYLNTGEYLVSLNLNDEMAIADLIGFVSGHSGKRYFDVCAFQADDFDLMSLLRAEELGRTGVS